MNRVGTSTASRWVILSAGTGLFLAAAGSAAAAECDPAWTVVPSANANDDANALGGLGVVAPDDIWACGSYTQGAGRRTLIERWDGKKWSTVPSPNGSRNLNFLAGFAVVAKDDVWVAGYTMDPGFVDTMSETLIAHWEGEEWKTVPSPNVTAAEVSEDFGGYPVKNELYGIAAASKEDIWAVGRSYTIVQGQELIIHWDGDHWSVVPSPHPGVSAWLRGVTVVSSTDVWAFGETYVEVPLGEEGGTGSLQRNLIEHWDGGSWTVVESPNYGTFVNSISAGTAVATDDIWAVGYYTLLSINQEKQPTILHWDGVSWIIDRAPVHNRENTYLFGISALSATDIVAVGFYDTGPPLPAMNTLIERFDGERWNIVESANPGVQNYLYGVAAVSTHDIWAVGEAFGIELSLGTLVERFTAECGGPSFLRGDANLDGTADLSDAVSSLGYQFLGDATPPCLDALDADDNGQIEITDAIYLLAFLFQGGPDLPAPYPAPGADPTTDDRYDCSGSI